MSSSSLVEDWIRVHRQLLEQEADFTTLAIRAAQGEVPEEELDAARAKLLGMRELCNAVYGKAFPKSTGGRTPSE